MAKEESESIIDERSSLLPAVHEASRRVSENGAVEIEEDPGGKRSALKVFWAQKWQLLLYSILVVLSFMSNSCVSPFYPQEAKDRGLSETTVGVIFASYAFSQGTAALVFGKLVPIIGHRATILGGSLLSGGCTALIGALGLMDDKVTFTVYSFALRIVSGIGGGGSSIGVFAVMTNLFPDYPTTVSGSIEMMSGVGYMMGPGVGGLLYQVGGFMLPFVVIGGMELLCGCIFILINPDTSSQGTTSKSSSHGKKKLTYCTALKVPLVPILLCVVVLRVSSCGYISIGLGPHLQQQFRSNPAKIGSMFLIMSATYAITSPLIGAFIDRKLIFRPVILCGFLFEIAALLLLGPSPLLHLKSEMWMVVVGLSGFGLSMGLSIVPVYSELIRSMRGRGYSFNDVSTFAQLSGMVIFSITLGDCLGPLMAGVLIDNFGFPWACTIQAGLSSIFGTLVFLFSIWEFHCSKWCGCKKQRDGSVEEKEHHDIL